MTTGPRRTIVVIGAGIVGLTTALELQKDGHRVRVVDPGPPGGRQSASYGHGAWINPASVMPTSLPGLWRQVPGMMRDPVGPFYIAKLDMIRLLPWLLRFLWAGSSWDRVEACAVRRYALCRGAVEHHAALAEAAGVSHMLRREGLVTVFRSRDVFARGKKDAAIRDRLGIVLGELDAEALRAREPDLSDGYTFASVVREGAYLADTAGYCRALGDLLVRGGGDVVNARVLDFEFDGDRLAAVRTDNSRIDCDVAVLAAGAHSLPLARKVGDAVSMASERGYHVQVSGASAGPRHSLILSDGKVAISPQPGGFRVAGQVELAPVARQPNWRRADIMLHHAARAFPGLDLGQSGLRLDRWMGHRPSTPDGLPVIGPSRRSRDVIHAFGHGHAGPTMAPATARAVAALVAGRTPEIDQQACSPRRFRVFGRRRGPRP